jgi:uncharacterized membrane protein
MTRKQPVANQLAAIAYPDFATAERARDELIQLTREGRAHLEDAVVVERELGGEIKLHQFKRAVAGGAAAGAVPGEVVHTSLSTAGEKRLRDALAEGPAAVHWNT